MEWGDHTEERVQRVEVLVVDGRVVNGPVAFRVAGDSGNVDSLSRGGALFSVWLVTEPDGKMTIS